MLVQRSCLKNKTMNEIDNAIKSTKHSPCIDQENKACEEVAPPLGSFYFLSNAFGKDLINPFFNFLPKLT